MEKVKLKQDLLKKNHYSKNKLEDLKYFKGI